MIKLINACIIVVIFLVTSSSKAQLNDELLSWEFMQRIPLQDSVAMDPNARVMFADDLLLVADHSLQNSTCGRVLVFAIDGNGYYQVVQELSGADFNQVCDEPDGFGFSLAYSDGNLFVGAPGDVFGLEEILARTSLPPGAVYIYSRDDASGFESQQFIRGPGKAFNRAWGTNLEARESILLVQGNRLPASFESAEPTLHGYASPNRVNQLNLSADGQWLAGREFANSVTNNSEIYGQDFAINESGIFITKVMLRSVNIDRGFEFYRMRVEVHALNSGAGEPPFQEIQRLTSTRFDIGEVPSTNTIDAQPESFFVAGLGGTFDTSNPLWRIHPQVTFFGYVLRNGTWVLATDDPESFGSSRTVTFGQLSQFTAQEIVSINADSQSGNELVLESVSSPMRGQSLVQRQRFINDDVLSIVALRGFVVNQNNLVIINNQSGRLVLSAFKGVPALDPAITQAWWFGPEFDGQGITLEVLQGNRLLMHWFTYDQFGNQMWLRGVGQLDNDRVVNISLVRAMGPRFPIDEFNPAARVVEPWGNVVLQFDDCRSGRLIYQSNEFGGGELPLLPLVNNNFECDTGVFEPTGLIAGSFFDPDRSGEGIIFMPAGSAASMGDGSPSQQRVVGLWLTYTPTGEQAWYYLGIYEPCPGVFVGSFYACLLHATQTPRSTSGPVFGDLYNPDDRVSIPWGSVGPLIEDTFGPQFPRPGAVLSFRFVTPHGNGTLFRLEQITRPIGFNRNR